MFTQLRKERDSGPFLADDEPDEAFGTLLWYSAICRKNDTDTPQTNRIKEEEIQQHNGIPKLKHTANTQSPNEVILEVYFILADHE